MKITINPLFRIIVVTQLEPEFQGQNIQTQQPLIVYFAHIGYKKHKPS